MNARDIMTTSVACCAPETPLPGVAKLMVKHDCGAIPIVDDYASKHVVGVVTDRDIVMRAVAEERNTLELSAQDCMTMGVATVKESDDLEEVQKVMESHQIRRVPVVDDDGNCVGIISQADLALRGASSEDVAEVLQEISKPSNGMGETESRLREMSRSGPSEGFQ